MIYWYRGTYYLSSKDVRKSFTTNGKLRITVYFSCVAVEYALFSNLYLLSCVSGTFPWIRIQNYCSGSGSSKI